MSEYLCDVVIPAFNEKEYFFQTIQNLVKQSLFKKGLCHVIVGEYKDPINKDDNYVQKICDIFKDITYVDIDRKGIGYGRHQAIQKGGKSNIIVNFDSDSILNRLDALELLIMPILDKEAVITNCKVILYDFVHLEPLLEKQHTTNSNSLIPNLYSFAASIGVELEKLIFARGPGLCVSREAYDRVGGFRDTSVAEDWFLSFDIVSEYGILKKKFINDVIVLSSDRRSKGFATDGFLAVDYTKKHYR